MKKIIRLTESDLTRIVNMVINESKTKPFKKGDKVSVFYKSFMPNRYKKYDNEVGEIIKFGFDKNGNVDSVSIDMGDGNIIGVPIYSIEKI